MFDFETSYLGLRKDHVEHDRMVGIKHRYRGMEHQLAPPQITYVFFRKGESQIKALQIPGLVHANVAQLL
jgi:hypothetical protein